MITLALFNLPRLTVDFCVTKNTDFRGSHWVRKISCHVFVKAIISIKYIFFPWYRPTFIVLAHQPLS